jgi:hypothetical protein
LVQSPCRIWLLVEGVSIEGLFIAKEERHEHDIQRVVYVFENESGTFTIRVGHNALMKNQKIIGNSPTEQL